MRALTRNENRSSSGELTQHNQSTAAFKIHMKEEDYYEPYRQKEIRHLFIKYVYIILFIQLAYTSAIACFFRFHEPSAEWLTGDHTKWSVWVALAVYFLVALLVIYCKRVRKTFPVNFIMLFIISSALGYILSFIMIEYSSESILLALGCTSAVCICLTIFACQTKYDFTVCRQFFLCGAILVIVMAVACFFFYNRILEIVYASIAVVFFSFFLVYVTQLIVGGNNKKYQIEPDEYILGALTLYVNIITIFLLILTLRGR